MKDLFAITSPIISGVGMGRKLGYPTINLVYPEHSDFETGVYFCRVSFADAMFFGVMHLGPRKTLDNIKTFEIYLLNFKERETLGHEVYVEVYKRIRDVKHFDSKDELVKAIEKDVKLAVEFFDKVELE